jgi:hypothetical protein
MAKLLPQPCSTITQWSDYFTQRVDATNRQGLTPLQKCIAAIRQLANGSAADHLDDYLKIGETNARKDIERAFGVLQRRFCILKQPARLYDRNQLRNVVLACIILHNMIVEDEKEDELEES